MYDNVIQKKDFIRKVISIYGYEDINYIIALRDSLNLIIKQRFDNKPLEEIIEKVEGYISI